MKFTKTDLNLLRAPFLFLVAACVLGTAWIVGTYQYRHAVEDADSSAQRSLGAARTQLENARTQKKYFQENAKTYDELTAQGLFGAERRLDWIERIGQLREKHQIFSIDYDIAPQSPFLGQTANLAASASKVDMKLAVLHEQDLLDFLADLKHAAPGIFLLDSCALKREGASVSATSAVSPNLTAYCTLQWITVKERAL
jgi:transposase